MANFKRNKGRTCKAVNKRLAKKHGKGNWTAQPERRIAPVRLAERMIRLAKEGRMDADLG